ncbi:uncharacterized protein LOC127850179 [Dreissena polymorpha]|uniref:Thioredoxin domain-containing protein 9 n=1 Tax=Dreissena polymorpha TaxID=45954 RepID=A0A9D4S4K5_DREPO|nr:uncharacterized protein LOC127850179 [Dreissena polymorpha]KAH3889667.1 hypothetical protein DPMN_013728 [Dreissena polymorpha]
MASSATTQHAHEIIDDESLAEEKLLEELEHEEIPSYIREARLASLKQQAEQFKAKHDKGYGDYSELSDQKEVLDLTTNEEKCVVHFFHGDFRRCAIIDQHLKMLTEKYFETRFAKINVDKAKFLVEKLKIRVLPAVLCFKKGIVVDRVVGFDELGGTDSFQTIVLERRLSQSGVIEMAEGEQQKKTIFGFSDSKTNDNDSSDDDY